jgi:hypothetical protein
MSNERDPLLDSLFAEVAGEQADDKFTAKVMLGIEKRRRNVIIGRVGIVGLLFAFEFLLSAPLQTSVGVLADVLSMSIWSIQSEWLAAAVAPLNSIAGIIGMLLLGMHTLYRRMVR